MKESKKIPGFKSEAEERIFWESHDSSTHVNWRQAKPTSLPRLTSSPTHADQPTNHRPVHRDDSS
ncbi:MAG: BrnA antitoxin family protein [Alcanivorax sp.]|nr:BrnA antitoxin family protein [Alcanivorax sp.]